MKNYSILVVDDEPDNFDVIETFLTSEEYQLYYCSSGYDAIHWLEDFEPDLILLDVMMPELDGIQVCREIKSRSKWKKIPIIMVTALNSKQDLANCLESGADDFIGKPVNSIELKARIKSMLRIKTQYDRLNQFSILQRNTINMLARNMDELTGNIATSLSHELNTPLNGIVGALDILTSNFSDDDEFNLDNEEILELLDCAQNSTNRLVDLTKRFLLYLQLAISNSTKKESIAGESIFSLAIIDGITKEIALNLSREQDLVFEIQEATLAINEQYLALIISELVSNALKFSPSNSPITISSHIDNNQLHICIHDLGKGMTAEQISKVGILRQFEREKHQQQGVGIGLNLVRMITQAVEGSMNIDSVYGKETKVVISLPIMQEEETMADEH
ncbi:hybrid sensor histidine kinase/response regulator [Cyanobacterium stanieri LEGE 03274]|uniref:histidine kinase n=1 Tax=Cyanobacterium stanieri LEGE 03274 TaxID=1828756 RepID=A0ABR9V5I6_9CHRO|nr:hybrid sensor histidine kinase/response regulator [Cyanobacterium stanieri]MBE9222789.1 hybrid sensor histidine kinase/response regulator [Cyanobacterium stanieri LEGE 03274]